VGSSLDRFPSAFYTSESERLLDGRRCGCNIGTPQRLDTADARRYGAVNCEVLQEMGDDEPAQAMGQSEFTTITLEKGKYYLAKEYPYLGGANDSVYIYLRSK